MRRRTLEPVPIFAETGPAGLELADAVEEDGRGPFDRHVDEPAAPATVSVLVVVTTVSFVTAIFAAILFAAAVSALLAGAAVFCAEAGAAASNAAAAIVKDAVMRMWKVPPCRPIKSDRSCNHR